MTEHLLVIIAAYGDEGLYKDVSVALSMAKFPVPQVQNVPPTPGYLRELFASIRGSFVELPVSGIFCHAEYDSKVNKKVILDLLIDSRKEKAEELLTSFFGENKLAYRLLYYGGHGTEDGWIFDSDEGDVLLHTDTIRNLLSAPGGLCGDIFVNCCAGNKWVEKARPATSSTGGKGALMNLRANNSAYSRQSLREVGCSYGNGLKFWSLYEDNAPININLNQLVATIEQHFGIDTGPALSLGEVVTGYRKSLELQPLIDCPGPPAHDFALYMFRNGNSGDCFLVTSEMGACNILIDGNHKRHFKEIAWPVLGSVENFHLVIGTHSDCDHVSGLELLTAHCADKIDKLWVNEQTQEFRGEACVKRTVANWKKPYPARCVENTQSGDEFKSAAEQTRLQVISPTKELYELYCKNLKDGHSMNDISIVSVVYWHDRPVILLPGDCSAKIIVQQLGVYHLADTVFEIAILPHHGSGFSNSLTGDALWFHRKIKARRLIINGKGDQPDKTMCNDLDQMLMTTGVDVTCYVAHKDCCTAEYFPQCFHEEAGNGKVVYCGDQGFKVFNDLV